MSRVRGSCFIKAWELVRIVPWIMALASVCCAASAQEAEETRFIGPPVLVIRMANWDPAAVSRYVSNVSSDLQVGIAVAEELQKSPEEAIRIQGTLLYLVPGAIPEVRTVMFLQVKDHDEFLQMVQKAKNSAGEFAVLKGSDDHYTLAVPQSVELNPAIEQAAAEVGTDPLEEAEPGSQGSITIGLSADSASGSGLSVKVDSTETADVDFTLSETMTYYRYHDGFLFQSESPALALAELPSGDVLRQGDQSDVHGELAFYPDRIPPGIRQLIWGAASAAMGADLQQRDEEKDIEYASRRADGDAILAFVQSMIFDLQKVSGSIRMDRDDQPLRGQLKIETRNNSDLAKRLREAATAESRMAPLLQDSAVATFHTAVFLPEHWQRLFVCWFAMMRHEADSESDAELRTAWLSVLDAMDATAESRQLEFMLKYGITQNAKPVIYGGIQTHADDSFVNSLLKSIGGEVINVSMMDVDGLQVALIAMDEPADDASITHVAMMYADKVFWFAYGGDDCHRVLADCVKTCRESSGATRTPLASVIVDLDRCRTVTKDGASGAPDAISLVDGFVSVFTANAFPEADDPYFLGSPGELLHRASQLGGTQDIRVSIHADESGAMVDATIGAAFVRGIVAVALSAMENDTDI